jgi:2'-hydroxyisoflavone reductase
MRRLLVLGGSWFLGKRIVSDALAAGWDVTTFRRGYSGDDVPGAQTVRGDRTSAGDLARLAAAGPWDAVVDTSGYVPANVYMVARALTSVAERYVFMSTVSVYRDWPMAPVAEGAELQSCSPVRDSEDGSPGDPGPALYGAFNAGCERAVIDAFGPDRSVRLRPGVLTGPREYVGRLPWWLRRVSRGGTVLAPGDPAAVIAPVDVRDVSAFVVHAAGGLLGAFNLGGTPATFATFLDICRQVTGASVEFEWIDDQQWLAEQIDPWVELPLWHIKPSAWQVDDSRARAAGYITRPLTDVVADVWNWMQTDDAAVDHPRAGLLGLDRDKETRVLAAWTARSNAG